MGLISMAQFFLYHAFTGHFILYKKYNGISCIIMDQGPSIFTNKPISHKEVVYEAHV